MSRHPRPLLVAFPSGPVPLARLISRHAATDCGRRLLRSRLDCGHRGFVRPSRFCLPKLLAHRRLETSAPMGLPPPLILPTPPPSPPYAPPTPPLIHAAPPPPPHHLFFQTTYHMFLRSPFETPTELTSSSTTSASPDVPIVDGSNNITCCF